MTRSSLWSLQRPHDYSPKQCQVFELLLNSDADVNQRGKQWHMTALLFQYACHLSLPVAEVLIAQRADVNVVCNNEAFDANALFFCLRSLANNTMVDETPKLSLHAVHVLSRPNDETER